MNLAGVQAELAARGFAVVPRMLAPGECRALRETYEDRCRFRSRVQMQRHGFGRGEYSYFAYPLPRRIASLRTAWYRRLAAIANAWNESLRVPTRFPPAHGAFLDECRAHGQTRPTPLLLRYHGDDYNCLHQDVYGEVVFPLQITCLLSVPDREFTGGELVLTEQRPRMQSRVEVVPLRQGDGVVFAVHHRPATGARGTYRVNMRHGVSRIRSGERFALGIIFHDAL